MNEHINHIYRQQITDYDCVPYVAKVMYAKEKMELTTGKRSG